MNYRQHVGEMRSDATETGSGQERSDAGYDKRLPAAVENVS